MTHYKAVFSDQAEPGKGPLLLYDQHWNMLTKESYPHTDNVH